MLDLHKLHNGIRRRRRARSSARKTNFVSPRLVFRAVYREVAKLVSRVRAAGDSFMLGEHELEACRAEQLSAPTPRPLLSRDAMRLNDRYSAHRVRKYPGRNIGDPLRHGDGLTATQRAAAVLADLHAAPLAA